MDESFRITLMQTLSTLLCSTKEDEESIVQPLEIYKRRMSFCRQELQNGHYLQPKNEAQLSSDVPEQSGSEVGSEVQIKVEPNNETDAETEFAVEVPQYVLSQDLMDLMDAACVKSEIERQQLAEQSQSDVVVKLEHGDKRTKRTKRNAKGKSLLPPKSGEKRIQRKPRKLYRGPPIPLLGRTVRRRFIPTSPLSMDLVLKKFGDRKVFKFQFKHELDRTEMTFVDSNILSQSEKPKDLQYMIYM